MVTENEPCPTCAGSGVCSVCRGGAIPESGYDCQCEATHKCRDCYGDGSYDSYAVEQMRRLHSYVQRYWSIGD